MYINQNRPETHTEDVDWDYVLSNPGIYYRVGQKTAVSGNEIRFISFGEKSGSPVVLYTNEYVLYPISPSSLYATSDARFVKTNERVNMTLE